MFNIIKAVTDAGRALGLGQGKSEDEEAELVAKEVRSHGLAGADKVKVKVIGNKVVIEGDDIDQAVKEKILMAAGNIKGIGEVEDKIVATKSAAAAAGSFHTVQSGDTLGKIAQKHLGKASAYPAIFEANKPMLTHPDKIYPGQILRIPPKD